MNTRLVDGASPMSVYSGQRLLGTVEETRGGYVARNPAGAIVGEFATVAAAARALPERSGNAAVR